MVGLFTFLSVGSAVIWDLWGILDIRRGHDMVCPHPFTALLDMFGMQGRSVIANP